MNKGIIFAIGAAIGGIVGSELTFAWTKKQFEEKYDTLRRQDYEDLKTHFEEQYKSLKVYNGELDGDDENEGKAGSQNASVTQQEPRRAILGANDEQRFDNKENLQQKANKRSKNHTDYSKIPHSVLSDPAKPEVKKDESKDMNPYIITPDQFDSGENEKVTMNYYLDGTLTDDEDTPIDQNDYFPNIDIEGSFDDESDEPDLLFIRDPKLKIDYEISKILVRYPETTGEWQ